MIQYNTDKTLNKMKLTTTAKLEKINFRVDSKKKQIIQEILRDTDTTLTEVLTFKIDELIEKHKNQLR